MRRTSCLAVLALCTAVLGPAAVLSGGCGASPAITVVHLAAGERSQQAIRGDTVKTRRGGQEAYVGLRPGYHVVRGQDDWTNAWPGGNAPPMPSTLDTKTSMLLLAVAEAKDTVQLQIQKVIETGDAVHVWIRETKAGQNCSPKLERIPFDAVVAPRIDKPLRIYVEEDRADSCGEAPAVGVKCRLNDTPQWLPKLVAQPGDNIDCEMSSETRGKFALVDSALTLGQLPGGSSSKLSYTKGPARGTFAIDVFGTYVVHAEASDEAGRKTEAAATVEALPPKTRDVLVQLVWTNFDVSDDPDTFPRVKLRATEETVDARKKPVTNECSLETPRPDLCEVRTRSAYTHMRLKASDKRIPLDVLYADERIEKGPLVCVQLYFDGARTGDTCDRKHRDPDERWQVGTVDMASGKLVEPAVTTGADAGADGGNADAGTTKKPPVVKQPIPKTPIPPKPLPSPKQ
jgi:hypothetical protein